MCSNISVLFCSVPAESKNENIGENNLSNQVINIAKPLEKIDLQVSNTTIYTNRLINKRIS